jgi:hypothetical protein
MFEKWRESAFWQNFEREYLQPFALRRMQQSKSKVFRELMMNVKRIKMNAQMTEDAWLYHLRSRLSKAFNSLLDNAKKA